jgi:hypothetical protein
MRQNLRKSYRVYRSSAVLIESALLDPTVDCSRLEEAIYGSDSPTLYDNPDQSVIENISQWDISYFDHTMHENREMQKEEHRLDTMVRL